MVTIKDVARVAGVSPSTVSRVVRGQGKVGIKCRAKVQKVIDEMGYRPNTNARALVSRRSALVGVVSPALHKPFFGSIAHGAEREANKHSFKVMTLNSLNDTQAEINGIHSLQEHGCQNIIVHSKFGDEETFAELTRDIPGLVFINRFMPSIASRCVWLDNVSGGRIAADYLYKNGHTQIAIVSFNSNNQDQEQRIQGIKQGFAAKGITIPEQNILFPHPEHIDNFNMLEYCVSAVKELYAKGAEFTAIIAYNDEMAIGIMNTLFDLGKNVPNDVSVIGFDDLDIARICRPALTTIRYPIVDMAEYGTKLSLQLSSEAPESFERTHLFMPTLVERKSVKNISPLS
ncbi:LacI family DNA-binding transcriptional regulator [Paraglaciecola sp. L3A3]|uniref:LacI family DNA-binding transcriptional regulator n=1 Tax=Paraglaciecola sp. L3A3 TaxID=2686358 RepID=UPI00131D2D83|nr:LacI family DNA-binding transcriptional regulator [Paraglaciecola sp. L3A3]